MTALMTTEITVIGNTGNRSVKCNDCGMRRQGINLGDAAGEYLNTVCRSCYGSRKANTIVQETENAMSEESNMTAEINIQDTPIVTAIVIQTFDKPRKCGDCERRRMVSLVQVNFSEDGNTFTVQLCSECLSNRTPVQDEQLAEDTEAAFTVISTGAPAFIVTGDNDLDGVEAIEKRKLLSSAEVAALIQSTYSIPGSVYAGSAYPMSTSTVNETVKMQINGHSDACVQDVNLRCSNCDERICRWECPAYGLQSMSEWAHHRAECVGGYQPENTNDPQDPTDAPKPRRRGRRSVAAEGPAYTGHVGPESGEVLPQTFTTEIQLRILTQHKAGANAKQLADAWGRSVTRIGRIVKQSPDQIQSRAPRTPREQREPSEDIPAYTGYVGPQNGEELPKMFTKEIQERIFAQHQAGASVPQLAEAWGRSTTRIGRIIVQYS